MKKQKGRKRRPASAASILKVLGVAAASHSCEPLNRSQQVEVSLRVHSALKALVEGRAEEIDMLDLVNAANISMVLARDGLGDLAIATAGQDACARIGARHKSIGRYVGTGEDVRALQEMVDQYDAQVASPDCTEAKLMAACRAVERAVREGNVVQVVEVATC